MGDTIDTGDTVLHAPTGETWTVAYVRNDRIAWLGWPEGEAYLRDVTLVEKATPEGRRECLELMAQSVFGPRARYAASVLAADAPTPEATG